MSTRLKESLWRVCAALVVVVATGCTSVIKVPSASVGYPEQEKIKASVQLAVTEDLKKASWEAMVSPTDKFVIPIGDELVKQAENLARAVFKEVNVSSDGAPLGADDKASLRPRLVAFSRTQPTTIFGDQTTTIILEWRLTGKGGETLWIETCKGVSTTKMGANPGKSAITQVQTAIRQLFQESYKALTSSPNVRGLADMPK